MVNPEISHARYPIVFLLGPTAVGKSDFAIALANSLPLSIISVDSVMVYRGLDIGTDKPSAKTLAKVPHELVNIRDPDQSYSVAAFRRDALAAIDKVHRRDKIPLLVGGTCLYFYALEHGLSTLPAADPILREKFNKQAERFGWPALHKRLRTFDPLSAERIHPNDAQRIQRALEICQLSNQSLSTLLAQQYREPLPYPIISLVLQLPTREQLHQRIAQRFRYMLDNGLLEELTALRQRYRLHPQLPSMRAAGYRQALQVLDHQLDVTALLSKGIVATRQLARRQLTWLRSRSQDIPVDGSQPDAINTVQRLLQQRFTTMGFTAKGFTAMSGGASVVCH